MKVKIAKEINVRTREEAFKILERAWTELNAKSISAFQYTSHDGGIDVKYVYNEELPPQ